MGGYNINLRRFRSLSVRVVCSLFRRKAACPFLLRGQKKETKEKAALLLRPSGALRSWCFVGVCRRPIHGPTKDRRHPCRLPAGLVHKTLRYSAQQKGLGVRGSLSVAFVGWIEYETDHVFTGTLICCGLSFPKYLHCLCIWYYH